MVEAKLSYRSKSGSAMGDSGNGSLASRGLHARWRRESQRSFAPRARYVSYSIVDDRQTFGLSKQIGRTIMTNLFRFRSGIP